MYKRQRQADQREHADPGRHEPEVDDPGDEHEGAAEEQEPAPGLHAGEDAEQHQDCLLYTSDAADERSSVDLGGRRIIKKKNNR